jgi:HTH-type transcriptional regulator, sugar sensing transcriptional regulator
MEIKKVLQDFGLTENEADIYLVLLKLGSATASEILEKTSVHRINLYDILERLQEKGFVSFVILGKRKAYEAINPEKFIEIEKEKQENLKKIMPELSSYQRLSKSPQEATIFKDKKGIRNILDEIANSKEFDYFASGWGFYKYFPEYADIWAGKIRRSKTKARCLMSNKFRSEKIIEQVEYKYLPNEFIFPSTTVLWKDKVFIIMWSEEPMGILIRSRAVSISYKQFFEMLWKIAKK